MPTLNFHRCEDVDPTKILTPGQPDEEWACSYCGEVWIFCADEADGGLWLPKTTLEEDAE